MPTKKFNWPPKSYRKQPLGAWPDDKKHEAVLQPEDKDTSGLMGTAPEPEVDDDVTKNANDMDMYPEDENLDNPDEVDISKQVKISEDKHLEED